MTPIAELELLLAEVEGELHVLEQTRQAKVAAAEASLGQGQAATYNRTHTAHDREMKNQIRAIEAEIKQANHQIVAARTNKTSLIRCPYEAYRSMSENVSRYVVLSFHSSVTKLDSSSTLSFPASVAVIEKTSRAYRRINPIVLRYN